MEEKKTAYQLLGFAVITEIVIASDFLIAYILSAFTDNQIVKYLVSWLLIYFIWGIGFIFISKKIKPLCVINKGKTNWVVYAIVLIITILLSIISWGGFKPYVELTNAISGLGIGLGIIAFILQYIYYALEAALMLLILKCGQLAGEKLFTKKNIPYGAIVLAILWGIPHLFSKGIVDTVWVIVFSFLYGVAYNAIKAQKKLAFPLIYLIFIL